MEKEGEAGEKEKLGERRILGTLDRTCALIENSCDHLGNLLGMTGMFGHVAIFLEDRKCGAGDIE